MSLGLMVSLLIFIFSNSYNIVEFLRSNSSMLISLNILILGGLLNLYSFKELIRLP